MSTELRILLTAERLFATQGIAGTSLRQISTVAGQRNTAAAQYHFGNKDALIGAIFRHRLAAIDARRRELLKLAEDANGAVEPWNLVQALVRPLAEQAAEPGSHYVRFLNRIFEHTGHDVPTLVGIGGFDESHAIGRLLGDRMPSLSRPQARLRSRWAGQMIIAGLADLERQRSEPDDALDRPDPEVFTLGLIDAVTGLLTAPVTTPSPREPGDRPPSLRGSPAPAGDG